MSLRNEQFISIRQINKGIEDSSDSQDIADQAVSDSLNMLFRNGYPETRKGTTLKWSKPAGETNDLLNLLRARDSSGNDFAVAVYAPNFYVRDEANDQWIKINSTYTPSATYKTYSYGYINWNTGRSKDVLYACNGQESFIKWQIALQHSSVTTAAIDTTLTLDDGTYFPASGTIVVKASGSSEIYCAYSSRTGNILTLTAPIGAIVASGAGVTFQIAQLTGGTFGTVKGKVIIKNKNRLFVANGVGSETTVYFSVPDAPEDFTTTAGINGAGSVVVADGERDVISLQDFGEYILILKGDLAVKMTFTLNANLDAKIVTIVPVFSDVSMGPIAQSATIKKNNSLFYATAKEGIFKLNPDQTGQNTSVAVDIISAPIHNLYEKLSFKNSKVTSYNQFILWSCATNSVSDTVIVFDSLKSDDNKVWSRFNNWDIQDWLIHDDYTDKLERLYFGSRIDGNIYECFTEDYLDFAGLARASSYECYFVTKRLDYGVSQNGAGHYPSKLKVSDLLHQQGYMTTGTLYVDTMYDENGRLQTITNSLKSTDDLVYQNIPTALAMTMLGVPLLGAGSIAGLDEIGIFNMYIPTPIKYGYTNIMFKFYSNSEGMHWGMTGIGWNPILKPAIAPQLVQQTTVVTSTTSISTGSNLLTVKSWVFDYTPHETVNGITTVFTLPSASQAVVWADGSLLKGGGIDYTFSLGTTITFIAGRQPYSTISISYLPL